jgi:hypothetical protein
MNMFYELNSRILEVDSRLQDLRSFEIEVFAGATKLGVKLARPFT